MKHVIGVTVAAAISTSVSAQPPLTLESASDQFRHIEQACTAAYAKSPRIVQADTGLWVRHQYVSPSLSMAVRKNDSIDAPYVGTIQVKYVLRPESAATKDAVTALPVSGDIPVALISETLNFVFQKGKWVGVGIDKTVRLKMKPDAEPEPARTTSHLKDDLIRFATPAADCLGAAG